MQWSKQHSKSLGHSLDPAGDSVSSGFKLNLRAKIFTPPSLYED